ncbi:sigma factor-like helix-turn-helix DNA-binding protein [Dactylosporangium darangshiense]|uniref:sigma factor-like helix-turn-helix DNA-binding protein n=1 Tax=Dactylosporangium darangshiense TaxID=579108 RepID=UPI00362B2929
MVVLRHLLGLTEAETAFELAVSVGTVKSHNARALARLRTLLTGRAAMMEANREPGARDLMSDEAIVAFLRTPRRGCRPSGSTGRPWPPARGGSSGGGAGWGPPP